MTKYRKDVIDNEVFTLLKNVFHKVCTDFQCQLIECNHDHDHVHLLVAYPPKVALSHLVNSLKGVSSRLVRKDCPHITQKLYKGAFWSASYYVASCGGASLETVKAYILSQNTP